MTLDTQQRTFSVAQVTVAATVTYYNPATGTFQSSPPTLNRNTTLTVRVRVSNNSGYSLYIRPEVTFRKPDASTVPQVASTVVVSAGSYQEWDFSIIADQVGTWQHNLAVYTGLYADAMSLTISQGWTTAATVQAVAMGTVTGVEYQDPSTGAWQSTAPAYLVGHTLAVRAWGRNDSGVPMTARMDMEVKDPDNVTTTLTGSVVVQAVGELGSWSFTKALDKAGTWSLTFKLYGSL